MKASRTVDFALGISATSKAVHAVLVERTPHGPRLVRTFSRPRGPAGFGGADVFAATPAYAYAGAEEADSLVQIGDSRSSSDLFLASEFGNLQAPMPGMSSVGGGSSSDSAPEATPQTSGLFFDELVDLLGACRESVASDPTLAGVLDAGDVAYAELRLPLVAKEKPAKRHARLLAAAKEVLPDLDAERVAFLPMTALEADQVRVLALVPRASDSTTASFKKLRDRLRAAPPMRLIDAELPLLMGLAHLAPARLPKPRVRSSMPGLDDVFTRSASGDGYGDGHGDGYALDAPPPLQPVAPGAPDTTGDLLVVRAGAEDTLAIFLRNGELHHFEHMRSLTAHDAPETICSRVLLLQDEHALPDVSRILVLSEEGERELLDSFGLFFPESQTGSLRLLLPESAHDELLRAEDGALVPALVAALRLTAPPAAAEVFPQTNFLPASLQKRKRVVPFTWHVYALGILLFLTAFFFATRFVILQGHIEDQRAKVATADPAAAEANVVALQARVDSLQQVQDQYTHALTVLDTLLMGSDKWSRALELVSTQAATTRGMWVESWKNDGNAITLSGNSTSRDRVVQFTEGTKGDLQTLTFAEIRDFPVYSFTMKVPLSSELPEAARYLRELALHVADSLRTAQGGAPAAASPAATAAAPAPQGAPASQTATAPQAAPAQTPAP